MVCRLNPPQLAVKLGKVKQNLARSDLNNLNFSQMVSMGLPDVRKFPFLEAPPPESIENSILVLKEQDAMAEDESLTLIGKVLANLPGKNYSRCFKNILSTVPKLTRQQ